MLRLQSRVLVLPRYYPNGVFIQHLKVVAAGGEILGVCLSARVPIC